MDVLTRPRSLRQRCSQSSSVGTPAGPAQCNRSSETPSGHRSKGCGGREEGAAHRGQRSARERGQEVTDNHCHVVAATRQKPAWLRPQCGFFLFQTNEAQRCLCCRCCRARPLCEVTCDIGRSRRAVRPHLLPLSFHINWLPLSTSLPAAPRPKGCEF